MSVLTETPTKVVPREATTRDVLHRAADLLEEFGWMQHRLGSKEGGRFCALGAMYEAVDDLGLPNIAILPAVHAWGNQTGSMFAFNDCPGRTKEEVVAALREAAESAQEPF